MKSFLKENWITILGIGFLFTGILYFFKLAIEEGWLPPGARVAIGAIAGISLVFIGLKLFRDKSEFLSQCIAGLGVATLYGTAAYISFGGIGSLSTNALLLIMVLLGVGSSLIAMKYELRILYLITTIGGLVTPMVLKAPESHHLSLFTYLWVLNVGVLYVSAWKDWKELKIVSFFSSIVIYTIYYVYFDPAAWQKPFMYITAFFITYLAGFLYSAWKNKKAYNEVDQYIGIVNAICFIFWSTFIFSSFDIAHIIPMGIVGTLFIGIGVAFYITSETKLNISFLCYSILGVLSLGIAMSDSALMLSNGMNHIVNVFIWLIIILAAFLVLKSQQLGEYINFLYIGFIGIIIYWFTVAWEVEWQSIFGIKYIPFLNAGALVWMGMIFLGFLFSRYEDQKGTNKSRSTSTFLAIISHILVGGLLTVQISNLWDAYDFYSKHYSITLSIVWFIYALLIFLWGSYAQNKSFRVLGTAVLLISSLKVLLLDLSGTPNIQRVIALLIIGGITLAIAQVNKRIGVHNPDENNDEIIEAEVVE